MKRIPRKAFWGTLGCLIFVLTVLGNLTVGLPEGVVIGNMALWSFCLARTIFVHNLPDDDDMPKAVWPEGFKDWKKEDREWYAKQMELAGWEFDEGDKTPKHIDIGEKFPHDEVGSSTRRFKCSDCHQMKLESEGFEIHHQMNLRCQVCIDKRRRQAQCKHSDYDQIEITSLSDDHMVMVCKICGKQLH